MSIYRQPNARSFHNITTGDRVTNQFIISGSDDVLLLPKGVAFIELLITKAGSSIEIKNGKGVTISTGITDFQQDMSPLRCDYGFTIVGDIEFAKGFIMDQVFDS